MSENLNYTAGNIPAPVPSGTGKKKRKHIFGKVLLTLLVLIVIAAGILLYFHPGIIYTAKAYTAVRAYLSQERYAAAVDADLQAGSASAHLDTVLVKTTEDDLDVYALLLDGGTVYIADKGLFLSDGSTYRSEE
ncbi:MAG: hypothetical protein IKD62_05735, partial [Oscillospiraceae bacterium]|nr:hypothetical protein [Oscillospiraceae bacterium]